MSRLYCWVESKLREHTIDIGLADENEHCDEGERKKRKWDSRHKCESEW